MLLTALLLAAPDHCSEPAFCPPIPVVENAVRQREVDDAAQQTEAANRDGGHSITIFEPARITRFSDIYCDRMAGGSRTVTCQATAHYKGGGYSVHLFRLVHTHDGWKLAPGGLAVFHSR